jgi:uncharacterized membrane protein
MSEYRHSVRVDVPVHVAYAQWTQMEEFPRFMRGVDEVRQVTDTLMHWVVRIDGVRREFDAVVTRQIPDEIVCWSTFAGPKQAGTVTFRPASPDSTEVTLQLEFEPDSWLEHVGDRLGFVQRRVQGDLEDFKRYIEQRGTPSGRWPGEVRGGVTGDEGDTPVMGMGPAGPDPDAF